ncbi:MAG: flavodoxin family protein [Chloroflexi bacterium]|nr:flavodoxin family protein [Chloroflexota bacterium]
MLKVLGLAGSPRRHGNTDLLLERALAGAASWGAEVESLVLGRLKVIPCRHCDQCALSGICVIDDEMQGLHQKLKEADRIVLASPIFFMGVTAQAKTIIDRCQALWVWKYVLKQGRPRASDGSRRWGLFLSAGGRSAPHLFDPAIETVKAFFHSCDVAYGGGLLYPTIDEKGAILAHATALEEAYQAGLRLQGDLPQPPIRAGAALAP